MPTVNLKQDLEAHAALGDLTLRRNSIFWGILALCLLALGFVLLSRNMRWLGVAVLAAAVAIIVFRVWYFRYLRADRNRLAGVGMMRLQREGGGGLGAFQAGLGGGLGAGVGVAAGEAMFRALGRL